MAGKHNQLTGELQETASLYAAGALPENERLEFARHLEIDDCKVCREEVRELQSVSSLLALDLPPLAPSAEAKKRLMDQAQGAAPVRRRAPWTAWAAVISGFAAVAAIAILVVVMNDNAQLRRLTNTLTTRVAQLESQL